MKLQELLTQSGVYEQQSSRHVTCTFECPSIAERMLADPNNGETTEHAQKDNASTLMNARVLTGRQTI